MGDVVVAPHSELLNQGIGLTNRLRGRVPIVSSLDDAELPPENQRTDCLSGAPENSAGRKDEGWIQSCVSSESIPDFSQIRHKDMQVISLINLPLWNRARWSGTLYIFDRDDEEYPPIMALGFRDGASGQQIFREWREQIGEVDERSRLRISIVTGIDRRFP